MVRHAVVRVCAFAFVLCAALCGPRACAASQQSDELKQIKAHLKLALTDAKLDTTQALSAFNDAIAQMLSDIEGGFLTAPNIATTFSQKVMIAVRDVVQAQRSALSTAASHVNGDATVGLANSTLSGGMGDLDKFQAALQANEDKAAKKILATIKKFVKSLAKVTSAPYNMNVVFKPLPPVSSVTADDTTASGLSGPPACFSLAVGASTGEAIASGLAESGANVDVNGATATASSEIWTKSATQTNGKVFVFDVRDSALNFRVGYNGIGVPTP